MAEWRQVVGYEDLYEVSDEGAVRSVRSGREMTQTPHSNGYLCVHLSAPGKRRVVYVHTIVATAFHGTRPAGMQVLHGDDNPLNPRADNLRWGTPLENNLQISEHGRNVNALKTRCKNDHPFDESNTVVRIGSRNGREYRVCRTCERERSRAR